MKANVTKNFKAKNKKNKGFTLVELIIVIAIIAILGIILAPQYIKYVDKSRWATDQNNAKTLLKEVQTAVVDCQEQEKDPGAGDITMAAGGTTAGTGITADLKNSLTSADSHWTTTKVTNKDKAAGSAPHKKFVITIDANAQVTGEWSNAD